mmetsp:Transcript_93137/g.267146  ORF Transcript_93137/g.267146 Transcript_93137/m.267146 type:complete len:216 (+) Transcript_93137:69-716(+)
MATRALLLSGCLLARGTSGQGVPSCHGDLLVKGVNFAALSAEAQQAGSQAVARTIAQETGIVPEDVMAKVFAGDYSAPWSPASGRPPADVFVGSLISNCRSAEMVLGVFTSPQLQDQVAAALRTAWANTGALTGPVSILGASVVPENLTTSPPTALTDASGGGMGAGGIVGLALLALLLAAALAVPVAMKVKQMRGKRARRQDENDEERHLFTGH